MIWIVPLLSSNIAKWHSWKTDLIHRICCAQLHIDIYSASVEDKATVGCWCDCQLTKSLLKKIVKPLVEHSLQALFSIFPENMKKKKSKEILYFVAFF